MIAAADTAQIAVLGMVLFRRYRLRPEIERSKNAMTAMTKSTTPIQIRKFKDWTKPPVIKSTMAMMAIMMASVDMVCLSCISKESGVTKITLRLLHRNLCNCA
jgi:hypothetical protein